MCWQLALGLLVAAMLACSPGDEAPTSESTSRLAPIRVFTVSRPLATLAERIGGDAVEVTFPAPAHVDPAHWRPPPETIVAYQGADLILQNGAGFAAWTLRASLPRPALVDTSLSFADRLIPLEAEVTHSHGPTGTHSHARAAATVWLDPALALEQARAIERAFAWERPAAAPDLAERLVALEAELDALDARLAAAFGALGDAPVVFSHPVYQYLARRYELNGRALHWEPDQAPSEAMWSELDTLLAGHSAELMLWEAEPLVDTADALAARGVRSVVFAPGGGGEQDWLALMSANAERLETAAAARAR